MYILGEVGGGGKDGAAGGTGGAVAHPTESLKKV